MMQHPKTIKEGCPWPNKPFKKSVLHRTIKAISDITWEEINRTLIDYARRETIERGRKIRVDCTVVESNIHAPYDSELLVDSTRVLTRLMIEAKKELPGVVFSFTDHRRQSKRRNLEIMNARNAASRKKPYKDLIGITENSIGYGDKCLHALKSFDVTSLTMWGVKARVTEQLKQLLSLARQVVFSENKPKSELAF